MGAIAHYLIYELKVLVDGLIYLYYGMTGVLAGTSDRSAIEARKSWHISHPVKCLADIIGEADSVTIRTVKTNVREKSDALVDEVARND